VQISLVIATLLRVLGNRALRTMVDIIGIRMDVVFAHKKERGVNPSLFSHFTVIPILS
jgi:hypothetical protein